MTNQLLYQIALTMISGIGPVQARHLVQQLGDAASVFKAPRHILRRIDGIGDQRADFIRDFRNFKEAEREIDFVNRCAVTPIFITDAAYPRRLHHCYDAPLLLYQRGKADLNPARCVSIIGTRNPDEYGRRATAELIDYLAGIEVSVISGLAFGIDADAHRESIKNQLPTIGVLAHGLDRIYPHQHKPLMHEMISAGGAVISEFRSGTQPDRHNFPMRNRIVAGMTDATIVIQSPDKGGSIITAELANGYNRDVFAYPGRNTDLRSAGCNRLIRDHKAMLMTHPAQLAEMLNWTERSPVVRAHQKAMFVNLSEDEQKVVSLLEANPMLHIDEIRYQSGLSASLTAGAVLSLELQNVIVSLPGKLYRMS